MRSPTLFGNACCVAHVAPKVNSGRLHPNSIGIAKRLSVNALISTRRMFSPNLRACFPLFQAKLSFNCHVVFAEPNGFMYCNPPMLVNGGSLYTMGKRACALEGSAML